MEFSALNMPRSQDPWPTSVRVPDESPAANAVFGSFDAFKDLGNATESILWENGLRTLRQLRMFGEENLLKLFVGIRSGMDLHRRLVLRMEFPLHSSPWTL